LVKQEPTLLKNLSDAPLMGRLLVLSTNNRLGWKGENTSFYGNSEITDKKWLVKLAPGVNVTKLFSSSLTARQNKLESF
jgi:hypothetical protein